MANSKLLYAYYLKSGKKKVHLADKANVSRPRLNSILNNPTTATYSQAKALVEELGISDADKKEIFV